MEDRRLYYKLNQAQHLLSKKVDAEVDAELDAAFGIKTVQLGAVFYLLSHDGCMLKELSAGLGLNNSAVTTLAARMEDAGLIRRETCSVDGRSFRVFLTKKAKSIGQKAHPFARELNVRLARGFSDEEMDVVIRFLDSIASQAKGDGKIKS